MALCTDVGGCSDGWHYVQTLEVILMDSIMYRHCRLIYWMALCTDIGGCSDGWHYVQT